MRHLDQALVAPHMPIKIVVLFEKVNIKQEDGQRLPVAACAFPFHFEAGIKPAPVGDVRQPVLE